MTFSAIILGIALHTWTSTAYLIYEKFQSNWTFRIAIINLFAILGFIIVQIIQLDYFISTYAVSDKFIPRLQAALHLLHFLSISGISIVLLMKLSMFYRLRSSIMRAICILGCLVIIGHCLGDVYGFLISLDVMEHRYARYVAMIIHLQFTSANHK